MRLTDTAGQILERMLLSVCMAVSGAVLFLPSSVSAGTAPGSTVRKAEPAARKTAAKAVEKKTASAPVKASVKQSAVKAVERKPAEKAPAKTAAKPVPSRSSAVASVERQDSHKTAVPQKTKHTQQAAKTVAAAKSPASHKPQPSGMTQHARQTVRPIKKNSVAASMPELQESSGKTYAKRFSQPATQTASQSSSLPEFQVSGPADARKPIVEKPVVKQVAQKGDIRAKPKDPRQYSERTKNAAKQDNLTSKIDEIAKQDYRDRYSNNDTPRVYAKGDAGPRETKPSATITSVEARSATIETTIFAAAQRAGLPDEITKKFTNLFSIDVDMDISDLKGSRFNVIYEVYRKDGRFVKAGNLLAAEFIHEGVHYQTIWYEKYTGKGEYYDVEGRSLKASATPLSSPLRTPLDNFRISSGFGYRIHPVTGGLKHHKGLDMAAATGTPIHAAADGTIREAGWHGGYGNLVVIQHTSVYATAYGHMSRIHPSMAPGLHVRQGDVIGYVGSTGMSTGPHLHYEVRVNGIQQDPAKIASISGISSRQNVMLTGSDKTRFRKHLYRMQSYFAELNANPSKRISS
ncbi:MAG: peptidoglycan DD-metalloendopeptidase family protein [Oxalobacter sp.]|nr:peptidoglycan DD-metalloendopeptidase family protein [Oxalobacter sp.]